MSLKDAADAARAYELTQKRENLSKSTARLKDVAARIK